MMDTVVGKIVDIKDTVQVTETFTKREVWLELPSNHPQTISIEFVQGFTEKLDAFSVGNVVEVGYTLRGRIYKDKVYTSLQGYKIEAHGKQPANKQEKEEETDLPF